MATNHKTAKGISFDMESFTQSKTGEVALGNMATNARGDVLGKGGKIEVKREKIVRDYYREEPAATVETSIQAAPVMETTKPTQAAAQPKETPSVYLSPAEALKAVETQSDEIVETKKKTTTRKPRKS